MLAANFANTICVSVIGEVSRTSIVRSFRSSAMSRMVMIGTVSRNSVKIWKNR